MRSILRFLIVLLMSVESVALIAQTLTDGPIQLQTRVRRINTTFGATDQGAFGIGFTPDDLTYYVWSRDAADVDGVGWQGGACLTANFNPPNLSPDFNYTMFNFTYPGATVPRYFDVRLDAWEDDINSDQVLGFCSGGTRCTFEGSTCCGIFVWGVCAGVTESDDARCNANPFRNSLDYRLGPPCQWYNHGFVTYAGSGCSSNNYQPEIESFWRYTRGTSCANALSLGTLTPGPGLSHYNSNVCYSNNFASSPGNDVFYSFTITTQTRIIASLCGASGAQFDSYLYLLDGNCNAITSNDNGCGNQSTITRKLCTPGTYYLVVDGKTAGAQGTFTLTLQQDPSFSYTASINPTNVTCNGANDGTATASATGGTTPYSFAWSNGGNTATISNLAPNSYTVTVTDADGCSVTATTAISQPTVLTATTSKTDVTCSGANDGTATVTPSGGTAPYTYRWSSVPLQTTATSIFLADGVYTVTVTDANLCTITRSVTIGTNSVINVSLNSLQNVQCFGQNNGSVTLNVSGGFTPYNYTWSNTATTRDIANVGPGNYTITVRDNSNCSVTRSYTITEPPLLTSVVTDVVDVSCNSYSDGSITVGINGGVQPYTYSWSNGFTTQNLIDVVAGNYTITVRDANNCTVTVNDVINEPVALAINETATNISCSGFTDGAINLNVSGGTPAYSYLWSNGAVSQNLNALAAGTYTVLVTDLNSCFLTRSITLTEPAPLSIQSSTVQVACNGNASGSIDIVPSGGTTPYSFIWSNGATTQNIASLSAGNYSLTFSDANNCSLTQSFTITEPPLLSASLIRSIDVSCAGAADGLAEINVAGGTPPYGFLWSNGATTQNIVNVAGGNYDVTVTDANNCSATVSATINEPVALAVSTVFTSPTCYGFVDGSITATISGGNPGYTFSWSNGATTQNLTNIGAGAYSLIVTDTKGCIASTTVSISEPQTLSITDAITNLQCNGDNSGNINISVAGGTPNYNYSWSNGTTTQSINSIAAGNYSLTVTDANNCSLTQSFTVTEPLALVATVSNTVNASCNGFSNGSIEVSVVGGVQPYAFLWSNNSTTQNLFNIPAGNYSLQVTDLNNCTATASAVVTEPTVLGISLVAANPSCFGAVDGSIDATITGGTAPYNFTWNTGATTEDVSALSAGSYTLVVTDNQNCVAQQSASLTTSNEIIITETITDVTCNGNNSGSITISVAGGTTPYSFNWSNNTTTQDLLNIGGGSYQITVTDAGNCSATGSYTVNEPAILVVSVSQQNDVSCFGFADGVIATAASGGIAPYSYLWSNNATASAITNISAGNYSVTVSDANNCTTTVSTIVTEPAVLQIALTAQSPTCSGATNGSIQSVISGGTTPYVFNWSNGATTQDITSVVDGNYTLVVTDAKNCVAQQTTILTAPSAMTLTLSKTDLNCFNDGSGSASVSVLGGTSPFTYLWSNNATTNNINNAQQGNYSVTVTDFNQCSVSGSITVNEPPLLTITLDDIVDASCSGYSDGSIILIAGGGVAPYQYAWADGATSLNRSRVVAGNYSLTLTDANSCTQTYSTIVNEPQPISVTLQSQDISCFGANDGNITATVSGGTAPYNYLWSNNATSINLNSVAAGNYSLLISDLNNCFRMASASVVEPTALDIQSVITDEGCNNPGAIDITTSGGTFPYIYLWSNAAFSEDLTNINAGNYSLTVTDDNNCSITGNYTVNLIASVVVSIVQTKDVSCGGAADGYIETSVSSGTPPFTFSWSAGGSSTQNAFNLSGGNYVLTVNDANNCSATLSAVINEPVPLIVTLSATQPSCSGVANGSITSTVSGGSLPYIYSWSNSETTSNIINLPAGSYSLVVSDANGCFVQATELLAVASAIQIDVQVGDVKCAGEKTGSVTTSITGGSSPFTYNWSDGNTTIDLNNVAAGNYSLTVTDINNCSEIIDVTINEPLPTELKILTLDNLCNGNDEGVAFAVMTGGIPPYYFAWSNGAAGNVEVADNLAAGSYSITVADSNGCTQSATYAINEPNAVVVQVVSITNASCYGSSDGAVEISASGGNGPYEYSLLNNQFQTTGSFSNLSAGDYVAIVSDVNGCESALPVTVDAPDDFSVVLPPSVVIFVGSSYTLKPELTGIDSADVTYSWSPAINLSCTDCAQPIASPITDIHYTLTITDASGCTDTATILIVVKEDYEVYIPNIFSPNGDGVNDEFTPMDFGAAKDIEAMIFNKWGELIFRTDKLQHGWDGTYKGKDCDVGVYTYFIRGSYLNGTPYKKTGSVTLIRDKPQ